MTAQADQVVQDDSLDAINVDVEDDESFADQINTTQLKKLQLQPYELCLMILSNAVSAMQSVNNLRLVCIPITYNKHFIMSTEFDENLSQ